MIAIHQHSDKRIGWILNELIQFILIAMKKVDRLHVSSSCEIALSKFFSDKITRPATLSRYKYKLMINRLRYSSNFFLF